MKISDFTSEQLKEELSKRAAAQSNEDDGAALVVGTLCFYYDGPQIEAFKKIETPEDLIFLNAASLRARMNSQRQYKIFYFKTKDFESLKTTLENEYKSFVELIFQSPFVKMESF